MTIRLKGLGLPSVIITRFVSLASFLVTPGKLKYITSCSAPFNQFNNLVKYKYYIKYLKL